jgi:hypothetical protein
MIILEEPTIVITYDRDRAMLHQKWTGYTPGKDFRDAVDLTFQFMAEKKLYKVLSDITEQKIISPHDQDYTKTAAAEYYNKTGNLKIAFITKPKSIAMACVSRYNKALVSEIGININNFFDCEEKALAWLLEIPEIEPEDINID